MKITHNGQEGYFYKYEHAAITTDSRSVWICEIINGEQYDRRNFFKKMNSYDFIEKTGEQGEPIHNKRPDLYAFSQGIIKICSLSKFVPHVAYCLMRIDNLNTRAIAHEYRIHLKVDDNFNLEDTTAIFRIFT